MNWVKDFITDHEWTQMLFAILVVLLVIVLAVAVAVGITRLMLQPAVLSGSIASYHDNDNKVTCWVYSSAMECIPDQYLRNGEGRK